MISASDNAIKYLRRLGSNPVVGNSYNEYELVLIFAGRVGVTDIRIKYAPRFHSIMIHLFAEGKILCRGYITPKKDSR